MARRKLIPKWLRPPEPGPGGKMSLADHLRELRYRVIVSAVTVVVASIVMAIWYQQLYEVLMFPYTRALEMLKESDPHLTPMTVITGVAAPFTLAMRVCVMAGLTVSSPVWLYQLWAYIVPALLAKEKKVTLMFLGAAVPLFLFGVGLGYYILPRTIEAMWSFTPSSVPISNLLDVSSFLNLLVQFMVVVGIGFLIPVLLVCLNIVGVLPAKALDKSRSYVIFGIFVFGALAAPSPDPFTMMFVALPLLAFYLIADIFAHLHDRAKLKKALVDA